MKVELKEGVFIEGSKNSLEYLKLFINPDEYKLIYLGKTSEIPEELIEPYILINKGAYLLLYRNYRIYELNKDYPVRWFSHFKTIKESIQSACPEEYCIIYKEKVKS